MANQQDLSIGLKQESGYGTPATVDRWIEFVDETLDYQRAIKQGAGLRVGNGGVARTSRRVSPTMSGGGDITVELCTRGLGTLLEACFGSASSTLVTTGVYQQVFTLGDLSVPMTIQKTLVNGAGVVKPQTYDGCVVTAFELAVPKGDIATLKTSWDARRVLTTTSYVTPTSYATSSLYHWGLAAATIGGTVTAPTTTALGSGGTAVTNVTDFNLSVNNNLDTDRYVMGGGGYKRQPVPGIRSLGGSVSAAYDDDVLRDAYLADTELPMTLTFTHTDAITTGTYYVAQVVLPAVHLDSEMPRANGGSLIYTTYNWTALDNGVAAEPIYFVLRTADTVL